MDFVLTEGYLEYGLGGQRNVEKFARNMTLMVRLAPGDLIRRPTHQVRIEIHTQHNEFNG